jgi:hypothetical protein
VVAAAGLKRPNLPSSFFPPTGLANKEFYYLLQATGLANKERHLKKKCKHT